MLDGFEGQNGGQRGDLTGSFEMVFFPSIISKKFMKFCAFLLKYLGVSCIFFSVEGPAIEHSVAPPPPKSINHSGTSDDVVL